MKNILLALLISFALFSCSKDDTPNRDNPNLQDPLVNVSLSLSLPQYNALKFPGSSIILQGEGIRGIVVYNVNYSENGNSGQYTAFELSDPNHVPSNCSRMAVSAPIATCPCTTDSNKYNIISGQHTVDPNLYPMQAYRISRNGDIIQITN